MNSEHIQTETLRRYLLGTLPDEDALGVEDLYFANPVFFNTLRAAEHVLIREYLDGSLDSDERMQFESRYLQVPILKKLVEEVRQRRSAEKSAARPRMLYLVLAAALACVVVAGSWALWHVRIGRDTTPDKSVVNRQPTGIRLALVPGLIKGEAARTPELVVTASDQPVSLVAELPGETSSANFVARILSVGSNGAPKSVWTSSQIPSLPGTGGQQVTVVLHSSSLPPGDYILELVMESGAVRETYVFRTIALGRE